MYNDLKTKIGDLVDIYMDNNADTDLLKGFVAALAPIIEDHEQTLKGCICWCAKDVQERARQIGAEILSDQEAQDILEEVIDDHDCTIGITWDSFDYHLKILTTEALFNQCKLLHIIAPDEKWEDWGTDSRSRLEDLMQEHNEDNE